MNPDVHTLIGPYVLDAVDDIERAAFTRHTAECESCAAEVDELREAMARLADDTWSVPPPRLRDDVLAQVGRTRQVTTGRRPDRVTGPRWRRVTAAAAAAIVAGGAAGATYAVQEQRVRHERAVAESARTDAARVQEIMSAADVKVSKGDLTGGGHVTVVASQSQDAGVVVLADAPAPASDRAYQLWLVDGTTPRSAGLLPAGRPGGMRLIDDVGGADALAVTVEPAAGSPQPTMTPLVGVTLA